MSDTGSNATVPSDPSLSEDDLIVGRFARELSDITGQPACDELLANFCSKHPNLTTRFLAVYHAEKTAREAFSLGASPRTHDLGLPNEFDGFVIQRRIVHRGMAEIYAAYDKSLQRPVAIKIIRSGESRDELRQRFEREKQVLARLHHTHIVPIHATGEIERRLSNGERETIQYFVMPFIEGAALNFVIEAANTHRLAKQHTSIPTLLQFISNASSHANDLIKPPSSKKLGYGNSEVSNRESDQSHDNANYVHGMRPCWTDCRDYAISVVQAVADVADAVHCAHESALGHSQVAGVIHRDIKPHNIMIEPNGHVWLIDFGLARFLRKPVLADCKKDVDCLVDDPDSTDVPTIPYIDGVSLQTQGTGGGTPNYMAPERWRDVPANKQTDIWSLGATLYELITLEKAFKGSNWREVGRKIAQQPAVPMESLIPGIPFDLAAICMKAMHVQPEFRYQTAAELSTDLRRWLNHEPASVVSQWSPHRVKLWARRNPHRAWLSVAVATLTLVAFGLLYWVNVANRTANRANQQTIAANQKTLDANNRELQRKERGEAILEIQRIQAGPHNVEFPGHSEQRSWSQIIQEAVAKIPRMDGDQDLRNAMVTSFIDPDATLLYHDRTTNTEYLTFDPSGEHLITGGAPSINKDRSLLVAQQPRILHLPTNTWSESKIDGFGPVAVRNDGVPVVLVIDRSNIRQYRLFDIRTNQIVSSWVIDGPIETLSDRNRPIVSLSADARWAIIATKSEKAGDRELPSPSEISVWDVANSRRVHHCTASSASAVNITPDGKLLAIGTIGGIISLWEAGQTEPFAELTNNRAEVHSMTFGVDYRRRSFSAKNEAGGGWLLAAGDSAGGVVIWDLRDRIRRTEFRGSQYETLSLAFSPDSSLLFSCGRSPAHIWDVATGDEVLYWHQSNYMRTLTLGTGGLFASAGSSEHTHSAETGIHILRLNANRGGRVLRGLRDIPRRLVTSEDGNLIAALTMQFEVGVWRTDGTLLHVFEGPIGPFADNATIAISPDNRQLFFCNGDQALTWNLGTAAIEQTWTVAPALCNESAWSPDGKHLWFARRELVNSTNYPFPGEGEQVARVYDLLTQDGNKPILELAGPGRRCYGISVGTNGSLVLTGFEGSNTQSSLGECWDLNTRTRMWNQRWDDGRQHPYVLTPNGQFVLRSFPDPIKLRELVDSGSQKVVHPESPLQRVSLDSRWGMLTGGSPPEFGDERKVYLFQADLRAPIATIAHEASRVWDATFFESNDHACLAWSNNKGHVVIIDIDDIKQQLKSIQLDWPESTAGSGR